MAVSFEETLQTKLNEIVASVQQEEKRLKAIEADLESKRAQLEEERSAFEAEKEMMNAAANRALSSNVKLDAGGMTYHASRTTLTSMHGRHKLEEDEDGRVASRSSESVNSSKCSGVSAVDQHQDLISPSPSAGPAHARLPIGLLFPDAVAVYVTMMSGVKEIPAVKDMLKKAVPILGFDLLRLCLEGPEHKLLNSWANRQCASYLACLAGWEKLRNQREEAVTRTQAMAGMVTGEIAALKAAGVFCFEDGLKLAKLYGEVMHEAALDGGQAMLRVIGLCKPKLAELCAEAAKTEGTGAVCQVTSEFAPLTFCAGGTRKSILELKDLAEKAGALQALVASNVAVHTPLMKPVEARLSALLDEVLPNMSPPRTTVYMNATGAPVRPGTNPKDIADLVKKQLTSPVLWEASVHGMIEEGVSEFYDVGPGTILKDLMRHQNPKIWRRAMTNIDV